MKIRQVLSIDKKKLTTPPTEWPSKSNPKHTKSIGFLSFILT
jgi:hypothetical protein